MDTDASAELIAQLKALPAHIRDPRRAPPSGIDARAAAIYRELVQNSVAGLLRGNFPVLCRTLGDAAWRDLVADFLRDHRAITPLFPEIGEELIAFLESRQQSPAADPAWLPELAHFEWVELALEIDPAEPAAEAFDPEGDLLTGIPMLSPLAVVLVYRFAVHRIVAGQLPNAPEPVPVCLLAARDVAGQVRCSETTPFTVKLIERLEADGSRSGREQLLALAAESGASVDAVLKDGAALLRQLQSQGVILGTRRSAA